MSGSSRLITVLAAFALLATGGDPGLAAGFKPQPPPKVKEYPAIPISGVKADGNAQAVRATADALKKAVTKSCPECGGKGTISVKGNGGGFARKEAKKCDKCEGKGTVPNDPEKVDTAALAIVSAIVRMPLEAVGADVGLKDSYEAFTGSVLRHRKNFAYVQDQSESTLAQVKPPVGKAVLIKATYLSETPPPNDAKDRVFLVRVSGKKQLVGVVAPKQADPPKSGGQVLVGGVVAGMVEPEMKAGGTARVMIVERGFLISPNVDNGWWNSD